MLAEPLGSGLPGTDSEGTLERGWIVINLTPYGAALADWLDSVLLDGELDSPAACAPHGLFAPPPTPYHAVLTE